MSKIQAYRGDDKTLRLNFTDEAGDALDITGYTVFFTVKADKSDSDENAKISKDVTDHTDAEGGQTTITIDASETSDLEVGSYYYDIQTKDGDGKIKTIVSDVFELLTDITQRTE